VILHAQSEKIIVLENLKELAMNLEDNLNKTTSIERNLIFVQKK
jgi:hypothetical protein